MKSSQKAIGRAGVYKKQHTPLNAGVSTTRGLTKRDCFDVKNTQNIIEMHSA
jgi:hypothetical protein